MNPTKPEQTASPEPAKISEARRKLIRAGLATGPVVATLASPSVFAAECVAPSQTLSAARSLGATQLGNCGVLVTADVWKSRMGATACTALCSAENKTLRDTAFHSVFPQGGVLGINLMLKTEGGATRGMTFGEVIDLSNGVLLAPQFIAAYLNIKVGNITFPVGGVVGSQAKCQQAIIDMWNEWVSTNGFYTPYAAATAWDGPKISYYLTHFAPI